MYPQIYCVQFQGSKSCQQHLERLLPLWLEWSSSLVIQADSISQLELMPWRVQSHLEIATAHCKSCKLLLREMRNYSNQPLLLTSLFPGVWHLVGSTAEQLTGADFAGGPRLNSALMWGSRSGLDPGQGGFLTYFTQLSNCNLIA